MAFTNEQLERYSRKYLRERLNELLEKDKTR